MFHLTRQRVSFFSFRGVKGSPVAFFSLWGSSVMCNSLQVFAQWRENIQSFHPWLRHHGLEQPQSSISLSHYPTAGGQLNEGSILGNPDCLNINDCAAMLLHCAYKTCLAFLSWHTSTQIYKSTHRWGGQSSKQAKNSSPFLSARIQRLNCFLVCKD